MKNQLLTKEKACLYFTELGITKSIVGIGYYDGDAYLENTDIYPANKNDFIEWNKILLSENYIVTAFIINQFFVLEEFLIKDKTSKKFKAGEYPFPNIIITNARNCIDNIIDFHKKYFEINEKGEYTLSLRDDIFFDFNEGAYSYKEGIYRPIKDFYEYDENSKEVLYKFYYDNGAYFTLKDTNHKYTSIKDNYFIVESHYKSFIKDLSQIVERILLHLN